MKSGKDEKRRTRRGGGSRGGFGAVGRSGSSISAYLYLAQLCTPRSDGKWTHTLTSVGDLRAGCMTGTESQMSLSTFIPNLAYGMSVPSHEAGEAKKRKRTGKQREERKLAAIQVSSLARRGLDLKRYPLYLFRLTSKRDDPPTTG